MLILLEVLLVSSVLTYATIVFMFESTIGMKNNKVFLLFPHKSYYGKWLFFGPVYTSDELVGRFQTRREDIKTYYYTEEEYQWAILQGVVK